jgi:competence ComEA-like helix-hairpin-helix protein
MEEDVRHDAELEQMSAGARATLAVLGALALVALVVLGRQYRQPHLMIAEAPPLGVSASTPSLAQAAQWDQAVDAVRQVDVNAADVAELERLPGVGPALARRIVEERECCGPFRSPEDLTRVRGIGPKTRERLEPYVTVE